MRALALTLLVLLITVAPPTTGARAGVTETQEIGAAGFRVLVYTRTSGFRHDSIPDASAAITTLGANEGFGVDTTEDPDLFADQMLSSYAVVAFVLTTGDVLNDTQQAAFERYIQAGGGYVGIHSATDTEYDWPWYGGLVGTYFADHPPGTYAAVVHIEDTTHPSTRALPETWPRTDEWYNFRFNPRETPDLHVLATLDESSYSGGTMGDHPIAWYHGYDGGRAWYTAGGHTRESYHDPMFLAHLLGGIQYAAGIEPDPAPN
jgi:cytochrome c